MLVDTGKWDTLGHRRIRKAAVASLESLPDAKRQMSASPSSIMSMDMTHQNAPTIPSADDVLVQVSALV